MHSLILYKGEKWSGLVEIIPTLLLYWVVGDPLNINRKKNSVFALTLRPVIMSALLIGNLSSISVLEAWAGGAGPKGESLHQGGQAPSQSLVFHNHNVPPPCHPSSGCCPSMDTDTSQLAAHPPLQLEPQALLWHWLPRPQRALFHETCWCPLAWKEATPQERLGTMKLISKPRILGS